MLEQAWIIVVFLRSIEIYDSDTKLQLWKEYIAITAAVEYSISEDLWLLGNTASAFTGSSLSVFV